MKILDFLFEDLKMRLSVKLLFKIGLSVKPISKLSSPNLIPTSLSHLKSHHSKFIPNPILLQDRPQLQISEAHFNLILSTKETCTPPYRSLINTKEKKGEHPIFSLLSSPRRA